MYNIRWPSTWVYMTPIREAGCSKHSRNLMNFSRQPLEVTWDKCTSILVSSSTHWANTLERPCCWSMRKVPEAHQTHILQPMHAHSSCKFKTYSDHTFVQSSVHSITHFFTRLHTCLCNRSFLPSNKHLFIQSLIRAFIHALTQPLGCWTFLKENWCPNKTDSFAKDVSSFAGYKVIWSTVRQQMCGLVQVLSVDISTAQRAENIPQRQLESQQDLRSCPFYGPLATCSKADLQYKTRDNEHPAILHDCILGATAKTLSCQLHLNQPYKTANTKSLCAHQCSHPPDPVRLAQAEHYTLAWPLGCSGWCMPMQ